MTRQGIALFGIVATLGAAAIYIMGGRSEDAQAMAGAVLLISALLTFIAILGRLGDGGRAGDIRQEVHIHGQLQPSYASQPQAQPVYYPQSQVPPAPQFIVLPSPSPAPAAPQFVVLSPEMFAQMQGQPVAHAQLPAAQFMGNLTAAPDGRYLAPQPLRQRAIEAQPQLGERLASRMFGRAKA